LILVRQPDDRDNQEPDRAEQNIQVLESCDQAKELDHLQPAQSG
jgi:hypothetical protein